MFRTGGVGSGTRPRCGPRLAAGGMAVSAALLAAAAGAIEPAPVGPQFQVNSYTTGYQGQPAVAVAAGGQFVVAWSGSGSYGNDDSYSSVHAQRFSALGVAQGPELQANSVIAGPQGDPAVAIAGSGQFVVAWDTYPSSYVPGYFKDIEGQRFAADGSPLGSQFLIDTYETGDQLDPEVATDAAGDFVVVWQSAGSSGSDSSYLSVQGQRFAAAGGRLGSELQANSYTTGSQWRPAVARAGTGEFVVVWASSGSAGNDPSGSVQVRRFSAAGTPLGADLQVDTTTTGNQQAPAVAVGPDGGFMVVWESQSSGGGDTSSWSIQGRRFGADGSPLGSDFQVNSYTTDEQRFPRIAGTGRAGGFVVVWQSLGSAGSDQSLRSIQGRRFDATGRPLGADFQVDSYTSGNQAYPAVGAADSGDFVVTWQSDGSGGSDLSGASIQAQRYEVRVFADGFESGGTGNWSSTLPD